jgi:hypothetical protein
MGICGTVRIPAPCALRLRQRFKNALGDQLGFDPLGLDFCSN